MPHSAAFLHINLDKGLHQLLMNEISAATFCHFESYFIFSEAAYIILENTSRVLRDKTYLIFLNSPFFREIMHQLTNVRCPKVVL